MRRTHWTLALAFGFALSACNNQTTQNQPAQPDSVVTAPGNDMTPDTVAALPAPDTARHDTAPAVMAKPHVQHTVVHQEGKIAPMPTGVREFRPDPGLVDNTPDPDASELSMVEVEPICLNCEVIKKQIQWPAAARAEGVGGTVYFKLLIDYSGKVKRYLVRRRTDSRLVNAAAAKFEDLRFRPAFKGGQPVKAWVDFTYEFK